MISQLEGKISFVNEALVILKTGGVGYRVFMTSDSLAELSKKTGEVVSLWIYTVVREDTLDLIGFFEKSELDFFELLLKVPGIGPKSALSVMGVAPLNTLRDAIAGNNVGYLTKISGIGKKTAEKIVFELRERISLLGGSSNSPILREDTDVLEALIALGYSQEEARNAVKELGPANGKEVGARVKEALRFLGTNK